MDFTLNIAREGEIRILQITDMQLIDANQRRTPDRIGGWKLICWVPEKNEHNVYRFIRRLVERTAPDLILITGDIVYGEFDDAGTSLRQFIDFMESFAIPWAPVWGNHDNETKLGVDWQNAQLEAAEHCLFKKGSVSGNGNYSIGIYQSGILRRIICMMDSNGCHKLGIAEGFRPDQLEWLEAAAAEADVPAFACFHIPTGDFAEAIKAYQDTTDTRSIYARYEIGVDMPAKNGDFGRKQEHILPIEQKILPLCKRCGIDGVFVGHHHINNISILHEGVRFTFGLKTGLYDYLDPQAVGGTLIRLDGSEFSVEHCPIPVEGEHYAIFRRCLPDYPATEATFNEKLHPDEAVIFEERRGSELLGFAMVHGNSISLLCVDDHCRGTGIGSRLLERAEEHIRKEHDRIILGHGHHYLLQGVPEDAAEFFKKRGYEADWTSVNMKLSLDSWDADTLDIPPCAEGVTFRLAEEADRPELLRAVEAVDAGWVRYYESPTDEALLACRDGRILGFELLRTDGGQFMEAGSVGCVGVIPEARELGIGRRMVAEGIRRLQSQGCPAIELLYTWLADWYAKLGFEVCHRQWMGEK